LFDETCIFVVTSEKSDKSSDSPAKNVPLTVIPSVSLVMKSPIDPVSFFIPLISARSFSSVPSILMLSESVVPSTVFTMKDAVSYSAGFNSSNAEFAVNVH